MANLVTVSEYKAFAGMTSTTRDAEINALLSYGSTLVKTYCGRSFIDYYSTNKTEYFDVDEQTSRIYPEEVPIVSVVAVYERKNASTEKRDVENNFADENNYHLLESGTPQCSLSTKSTETTCINNDSFTGSGLDDLTITGYNANTSSGEVGRSYRVQIDSAGTPDTFKWSRNGGTSWKAENVAITGSSQQLEGDIYVTFAATTGHTDGDYWDFTSERWTGHCSNTNYATQAACEAAGEFWTADKEYEVDAGSFYVEKLHHLTNSEEYFRKGNRSVKLVYKGGYASTPADLKLAIFDLITYYLKKESTPKKQIPGMASQDNASASKLPADFPPHIKRILDLYRNID